MFEVQATVAVSQVKAAGLVPKTTGVVSAKSWVLSQSPAGGTQVPPGSTVSLRMQVGPIP